MLRDEPNLTGSAPSVNAQAERQVTVAILGAGQRGRVSSCHVPQLGLS